MTIDIPHMIKLCLNVGQSIMDIYQKEGTKVQNKKDLSPLTEADLLANEMIELDLKTKYPEIPIISEEKINASYSVRKNWEYCWIIDPMDGTKEFIEKTDEFTVNIALIKNTEVVCGFVHIPTTKTTYYAVKGTGSYKVTNGKIKPIQCRPYPSKNEAKIITVSRFHKDKKTFDFINKLRKFELLEIGSVIKILAIAEGKADLYPRLGHLSEWDIAAAHIILLEAGGNLVSLYGKKPLFYNKKRLKLPYFLAFGKQ
ncbi:MAG: 3'(2'),5'-bisphosphate nucleotidase CysQ [Saprospiraceae bacterium]